MTSTATIGGNRGSLKFRYWNAETTVHHDGHFPFAARDDGVVPGRHPRVRGKSLESNDLLIQGVTGVHTASPPPNSCAIFIPLLLNSSVDFSPPEPRPTYGYAECEAS